MQGLPLSPRSPRSPRSRHPCGGSWHVFACRHLRGVSVWERSFFDSPRKLTRQPSLAHKESSATVRWLSHSRWAPVSNRTAERGVRPRGTRSSVLTPLAMHDPCSLAHPGPASAPPSGPRSADARRTSPLYRTGALGGYTTPSRTSDVPQTLDGVFGAYRQFPAAAYAEPERLCRDPRRDAHDGPGARVASIRAQPRARRRVRRGTESPDRRARSSPRSSTSPVSGRPPRTSGSPVGRRQSGRR